jgi:hypothetical protein
LSNTADENTVHCLYNNSNEPSDAER